MISILKNLKDAAQGKARLGQRRSPRWPEVRKSHLAANPTCALCGGKDKLETHHVESFHERPDLELEPSNLITLCESKKGGVTCHLFVGHLSDYKAINPSVREDASEWFRKIKNRKKPL